MSASSKKHVLLFLILLLSFIYRMLLTNWQIFPPGADVGLHNSIINSIIGSGNTSFVWNNYHMGGVASLTFPGYHIFASNIMLFTGLPDYFVHSLIVSFFSSFIVLCGFLLTRVAWGESASWIVVILMAISRFDLEILMWGGYPNVITLLLIPLIFYLLLEKKRFTLFPFLVVTGLFSASVFMTHSLSSVMFVLITALFAFFFFLFSKKININKTGLFVYLAPILLGAIIALPFFMEMAPAYLGAGGEPFTGSVAAIRLAMLATRKLPIELVFALFVCVTIFLIFSKINKGKFFTIPAVLFSIWLLVPTVLTQGFLFGLYVDYHRFLYFIILPILILIAISIDAGAHFLSKKLTLNPLNINNCASVIRSEISKSASEMKNRFPHFNAKTIYSTIVFSFITISFLVAPIFLPPHEGINMSDFYQVTTSPSYEAIRWVQQNTPSGSIIVSDALYGWWVSGFAQRPTLSAVTPQFLTLASEVDAAKIATNLLDTNYILDNGLVQVREDGGYIGRHNPAFLAWWHDNPFPYQFFHFNSDKTRIYFTNSGMGDTVELLDVPVVDMYLHEANDSASIILKRQNEFFSLTQSTTVYEGLRFVNMTIIIDSVFESISIKGIRLILHTQETKWIDDDKEPEPLRDVPINNKTLVIIDDNINVFGQLIFTENQPEIKAVKDRSYENVELHYSMEESAKVEMFIGVFQIKIDELSIINNIMNENIHSYNEKLHFSTLYIFDYHQSITDRKISYILCRDPQTIPKFAKDPGFDLVFANRAVMVFATR
jgi:hypothetical protein